MLESYGEPRLVIGPPLDETLTPTQTEILEGIANGICRKRIAIVRGVSPKTINAHMDNILERIGRLTGIRPLAAELIPFLVHKRLLRIEDPEGCNNCPFKTDL